MKVRIRGLVPVSLLSAAFFLQAGVAAANAVDTTFTPVLNTTPLEGHGVFELAFVLTDGSGAGDQNTNISLTNFQFGAGGAGGAVTPDSTGGFSGNLIGGATLTDSSFFNLLGADFTPGNSLSFTAHLTSTSLDSPTPDLFEFVILDSTGAVVPTTDPSGQDTLVTVNIDSGQPIVQTYSLPGVTVPETGSSILVLIWLAGAVFAGRKAWLELE